MEHKFEWNDLGGDFRTWQVEVEDVAGKLQDFFSILVRQLTVLKLYDTANLIWKAVKYRSAGGFYGRVLCSVPEVPFSQILDPATANYIVTYQCLVFQDREGYLETARELHGVEYFYHRHCYRKESDSYGQRMYRHDLCDPTNPENYRTLLSEKGPLQALQWIYDTVTKKEALVGG